MKDLHVNLNNILEHQNKHKILNRGVKSEKKN